MIIKNQKSKKKLAILLASAFILLSGVFIVLEKTNVTDLIHTPRPRPQTASEDTKGEVKPKNSSQSPVNKSTTSNLTVNDDKGQSASVNATTPPKAPSGDFVSNYQPNLGGTPRPNLLESVCNTTPGATCQISFTKDGATKSLNPETADKGGAVYWTWRLQDIGLTVGSWRIKATAKLNGQTVSTDDALPLEVRQ